jgi:hypothetical protein
VNSILDVNWAGNLISEGPEAIGQKLGKILTHFYFVGIFFFFSFLFDLLG